MYEVSLHMSSNSTYTHIQAFVESVMIFLLRNRDNNSSLASTNETVVL